MKEGYRRKGFEEAGEAGEAGEADEAKWPFSWCLAMDAWVEIRGC